MKPLGKTKGLTCFCGETTLDLMEVRMPDEVLVQCPKCGRIRHLVCYAITSIDLEGPGITQTPA